MSEYKREPIKAKQRMKEIMTEYFLDAFQAKEKGKKVAWITSGGPVEPLIAMDVVPIYPENHGAMIGAAKMGERLCAAAEEMGYCRELCSYALSDIACSRGEKGPIGQLPPPDMLICCNNICSTVIKWYEVQARYFKVPLFVLDTPMNHRDFSIEVQKYVNRQFDEYFDFLGRVCGRKFDRDRLEEVGRLSYKAQLLWQQVLATAKYSPAPMSAFDAFFHLALIVTLRGKKICIDYYKDLLEEMQERIERGICALPGERIRLLWDNLPIWYKTRWLSEEFARYGAAIVADTYTSAWCSGLSYIDPEDVTSSLPRAYSRIYLNLGIDMMAEKILDMVDYYQVDGVVMHSNRSCKPYSFGQYYIQDVIRDRCDVPVFIIESDMLDQRNFTDAQIQSRIAAFMEMVEEKGK